MEDRNLKAERIGIIKQQYVKKRRVDSSKIQLCIFIYWTVHLYKYCDQCDMRMSVKQLLLKFTVPKNEKNLDL